MKYTPSGSGEPSAIPAVQPAGLTGSAEAAPVAAIKAAAATANRLRILVGFAVRFTFDTISPNNK
jgi:hypothetical protein